jgi:integrase
MSKPQKTQVDWVKVGPCLYRYRGKNYYALVKHAGKQIRQSLETTDAALARRKLVAFKKDLEKINPETARRTLDDHREIHEKTLIGAPSTQELQRTAIRRLCEQWPKDFPREIRKINATHLKTWLAQFDRLAASSINQTITAIRKFFDTAVDQGVIPENPVGRITYRKVPQIIRLTPTEDQFEAIVADLRSQKANGHGSEDTADTVELAGHLGLGQAELAAIERQHIDLDAGTIKVFRRKTTSAFTIPIYPRAREVIVRRLAAMSDDPEARLLPHYNFRKGLEGACRRLNLPRFEPRALRRFFITQALRAGVDAPTVGAWQGHRDGGALVLRVYGDEVRMDHSKRMAALLAPKPTGGNVVPFKKEAIA